MSDPISDTPVRERTSACILNRNVAERPRKVAVIDAVSGQSLTYAEVAASAYSISNGLDGLGLGRQEHVLVMLGDHIDRALLSFGVTAGGKVEVPINTAYKGESLKYACELSGAAVLVIEDYWCDRLEALVDGAPNLRTVVVRGDGEVEIPSRFERRQFEELFDAPSDRPEPPEVWDVCTMISTSGTTGRSKGVLCPHGHVYSMSSFPSLEMGQDEVVLVTLPMFHAAGLFSGVYNAWRVGGTAVLSGAFSASGYWDQVREFGCTTTVLFGAQADFLWRQEPSPRDRDHTLRLAVNIPALPNAAAFTERFGVSLISGYGLTESGTIVAGGPDAPPLSCGPVRDFAELRIVDDHDIELGPSEVGEIVIRSEEPWSLMSGYHGMPEETAAAWRNLWLHSGDAGYLDDDGNLFFVDRAKDALRRRGENVSSFEVEQYLIKRDEVIEAAVVAVASEHTEDEIKAVLVLADDAVFEPVTMLRELYEEMPYFMVPRYLEVVDELPKTPTNKVRKVELRESGVSARTWDSREAGLKITRHGLIEERRAATADPAAMAEG